MKNMTISFSGIAIFFLHFSAFSQHLLPEISDSSYFIDHGCFQLEYNEEHKQAKWTYHLLTREMTRSNTERSDRFLIDPLIKSGSASDPDYKGSGYDRGHLVPSADMAFSEDCMNKSFYYSNMSPQQPSFNRGIWKKLETLVRYWAFTYDSLHIVSGPLFHNISDSIVRIGPNQVSIPKAYFKAVMIYQKDSKWGIGFILPNEGSSSELTTCVVSIDEIEEKSGLNLFASIEELTHENLESAVSIADWTWTVKPIVHPSVHTDAVSVQCSAKLKNGRRCKRKTNDPSGKCYQHQD